MLTTEDVSMLTTLRILDNITKRLIFFKPTENKRVKSATKRQPRAEAGPFLFVVQYIMS